MEGRYHFEVRLSLPCELFIWRLSLIRAAVRRDGNLARCFFLNGRYPCWVSRTECVHSCPACIRTRPLDICLVGCRFCCRGSSSHFRLRGTKLAAARRCLRLQGVNKTCPVIPFCCAAQCQGRCRAFVGQTKLLPPLIFLDGGLQNECIVVLLWSADHFWCCSGLFHGSVSCRCSGVCGCFLAWFWRWRARHGAVFWCVQSCRCSFQQKVLFCRGTTVKVLCCGHELRWRVKLRLRQELIHHFLTPEVREFKLLLDRCRVQLPLCHEGGVDGRCPRTHRPHDDIPEFRMERLRDPRRRRGQGLIQVP